MSQTKKTLAIAVGRRKSAIAQIKIIRGNGEFIINGKSISIGVSIGHIRNDGKGDLLHRADLAMYEAKRTSAEARAYLP